MQLFCLNGVQVLSYHQNTHATIYCFIAEEYSGDEGTTVYNKQSWNEIAVDVLCSLHIPKLVQYNKMSPAQKEAVSFSLLCVFRWGGLGSKQVIGTACTLV